MSEPKRTGLLQLLGNSLGCQFVIPVYQRNYTWAAEREVKQYFDDLQSVLTGDYKNHFMGIIIYLEKAIDFSSREFSIIDGQQRLTTTFLIIYAIKQLLVNCNDTEKVKQLEGQYLTNPYHNDKINPLDVHEKQLCQVLCAYRIFLPFVGITVSSRESAEFRNGIVKIAATKVSAGVSTGIGDHESKYTGKETDDVQGDEQFEIDDNRSLDKMYKDIAEEGLQPVLNDYLYV